MSEQIRYSNLPQSSTSGTTGQDQQAPKSARTLWLIAGIIALILLVVVANNTKIASFVSATNDTGALDEISTDSALSQDSQDGDEPHSNANEQPPENLEVAQGAHDEQVNDWAEKQNANLPDKKLVIPRPPDIPTTSEEALKKFRNHEKSYTDLYKAQLYFCGQLCNMDEFVWRNDKLHFTAKYLQDHYVSKPVDCDLLFSKEAEEVLEAPAFEWPPPHNLPLAKIFTLGGHITPRRWFFSDRYLGGSARHPLWSKSLIDRETKELLKGTLRGTYGNKVTTYMFNLLKYIDVKGKHVLVIGSENPWVEVAALAAGADHVTTLEYGKIVSHEPRITTMRPFEMNMMYRNRTLPQYDVAVSFSSLEHSGLGRYGDGINPWGDLITAAKTSCIVKQKTGYILFGVPSGEKDGLYYNAHRVYGPNRWPLFITNWWAEKFWKEHEQVFSNGIVYARNERSSE